MNSKDKKAAEHSEQLNTTSQNLVKSLVQKFFKKEGNNSAKCNICLKLYVYKTGGPKSTLRRHLNEKHREKVKVNEKKEPKQQSFCDEAFYCKNRCNFVIKRDTRNFHLRLKSRRQ